MLCWMRSITAMRRPFPRAAAFLAPVLGALVAAFAVGITVVLHNREDTQRSRQLALVQLSSTIDELQGAAWVSSPQLASLARAESRIVRQLRASGLASAIPSARANFAAVNGIARKKPLTNAQVRTYHALALRVGRAAVAAGRAAGDADTEALAGSAAAMAVLLASFWLLNFRLARAHRRAQADRMRLLVSTVRGAEEERHRIAADLHDGPIQRLTATTFSLDLLANQIGRGRFDSIEDGLIEVRSSLTAQMEALRRLMAELRPPVLDEGGVAAAIANHASQLLPERAECSVRDRTGATRFVPELEMAVYRIAGEALANVAKHADATHVDVLLERRGDELNVAVADDGVGFAFDGRGGRSDHVGLTAMRERVESVGGRLTVHSGNGTGTRVEAALPWRTRVEAEHHAVV